MYSQMITKGAATLMRTCDPKVAWRAALRIDCQAIIDIFEGGDVPSRHVAAGFNIEVGNNFGGIGIGRRGNADLRHQL
jgi:hypothetical protein